MAMAATATNFGRRGTLGLLERVPNQRRRAGPIGLGCPRARGRPISREANTTQHSAVRALAALRNGHPTRPTKGRPPRQEETAGPLRKDAALKL